MKPWIGPANNIANTVGQNKGYDVHLENMTTSDFFNHIIEENWYDEVRFFTTTMIVSILGIILLMIRIRFINLFNSFTIIGTKFVPCGCR